jgi:hypothetical protein
MERMHFECMEAEYGGYIPNSLANNQEDWDYIKSTWVNYMSSIRRTIQNDPNKKLTDLLKRGHQKGLSKARSWTLQRWEDGYNRIFHPDRVINTSLGEEEEDDEENSD